MESSKVLLRNLKNYYKVDSIRLVAEKMSYSTSIMLNWSSGRSSPSIKQLNEIAYNLGVEASELLVPNNIFTVETKAWRDQVEATFISNLGRLRLENDIHENFFYVDITNEYKMSYRAFIRYVNGKNKRVNLVVLDRLAKIFEIETYTLLEREERK